MTPEELAAYREWVRISNFESNTWPPMGLSHIDQQAAQIAELETRIDLLQNELFEMLKGKDAQEVISELMTRIDNQTVRISELEVDLEEERYNSEAFMDEISRLVLYNVDLENHIKTLKKIAKEGR